MTKTDELREKIEKLVSTHRHSTTPSHLTDLILAILPAQPDVSGLVGEPVRLKDCPPGLFLWNGNLCFRSEYATMTETNPNQPDAYVAESGEYFWGGVSTSKERDELLVQPIAARQALTLSATPEGGE